MRIKTLMNISKHLCNHNISSSTIFIKSNPLYHAHMALTSSNGFENAVHVPLAICMEWVCKNCHNTWHLVMHAVSVNTDGYINLHQLQGCSYVIPCETCSVLIYNMRNWKFMGLQMAAIVFRG